MGLARQESALASCGMSRAGSTTSCTSLSGSLLAGLPCMSALDRDGLDLYTVAATAEEVIKAMTANTYRIALVPVSTGPEDRRLQPLCG